MRWWATDKTRPAITDKNIWIDIGDAYLPGVHQGHCLLHVPACHEYKHDGEIGDWVHNDIRLVCGMVNSEVKPLPASVRTSGV